MAHNLYINDLNEAAFFSVKEPAWHGLGKTVEGLLTAEEAVKAAQLDFEVIKQPLYTGEGIFTNELEIVAKKYATVRSDTKKALGVVGGRYTILQNKDAFKFFDEIVGEGEAIYETAGVLGGGETIWIMAKMPEFIKVGKNDIIQPYLTLMNSHDGSSAIIAFLNTVRIVCNNTLNAALGEGISSVRIPHTASAEEKLKHAHKALGIANVLSKELEEAFNFMSSKKVSSKHTIDFLERILPDPADPTKRNHNKGRRQSILQAIETGAGADMDNTLGTWWGVYNGITYEIDHLKNYKDESIKLNSIWNGTSAQHRQMCFDAILEEIK